MRFFSTGAAVLATRALRIGGLALPEVDSGGRGGGDGGGGGKVGGRKVGGENSLYEEPQIDGQRTSWRRPRDGRRQVLSKGGYYYYHSYDDDDDTNNDDEPFTLDVLMNDGYDEDMTEIRLSEEGISVSQL